MLSVAKLRPGGESYYLEQVAKGAEEYYTGAGERAGVWMGRAAAELGLSGLVDPGQLSQLLDGVSPADGTVLYRSRLAESRRVSGFDMTFSATKSVSLLYGLGGEEISEQVRLAHHAAVASALRYLEDHAVMARRGHDGVNRVSASGLVGAAFQHRTSREGDPQLHTHVVVANFVHGQDGRWTALHGDPCYQQARTAGFVYQAVLRAELTERLGLGWEKAVNGSAEITGVMPELIEAFSKRREQILDRLEELGGTSRRTREIAALETRARKDLEKAETFESLRHRWLHEADDKGLDVSHLEGCTSQGREVVVGPEERWRIVSELAQRGALTEHEAAFERRDAVRGVAERLVAGASLEVIESIAEDVLAHPNTIALDGLGKAGERLHSARDLVEVKARLLKNCDERAGAGYVVSPEVIESVLAARPAMATEQAELLAKVAGQGRGVQVVIGKAGAGKTYALDALRAAFEQAGHPVVGTALSARAAAELESGSGIPSCTLARFLMVENLSNLPHQPVIVCDEAGMVGTRDLFKLAVAAQRQQATLVLVGDNRQLPAIQAGGAFSALARQGGVVELRENRRQVEGWERAALDELRAGNVNRALFAYSEHGRLHLCDSGRAARAEMVADWAACLGQGEARLYALARTDVAELNRLARAELRARGKLGEDLAAFSGHGFAAGDDVMFLKNDRRLAVMNGMRGTVAGLDESEALVVETVRGSRVVPVEYLEAGRLDYGYASTVHKSQGATVDRAFVLGSDALYREAGYVAFSRARGRTDLYCTTSAFDAPIRLDYPEHFLTPLLSRTRAKSLALEALAPTRAKELNAELESLRGVVAQRPPSSLSARRDLEVEKAEAARYGNGAAHLAEKEAGVAAHEQEVARFDRAHGGELSRYGELKSAGLLSERLLGEAAGQTQPARLVEELGPRPRIVAGRLAWEKAAGALEALKRGWSGLELRGGTEHDLPSVKRYFERIEKWLSAAKTEPGRAKMAEVARDTARERDDRGRGREFGPDFGRGR